MSKHTTYLDLDVWKQTKDLVRDIYGLAKKFPKEEQFGLTNQLRRSAVSIPSNIAESCGRNHFNDFLQLFFISRGSLYEVETQILISFDLEYIIHKELKITIEKINSCKRLLNGFINYFQSRSNLQPTTINEQLEEYGSYNKD